MWDTEGVRRCVMSIVYFVELVFAFLIGIRKFALSLFVFRFFFPFSLISWLVFYLSFFLFRNVSFVYFGYFVIQVHSWHPTQIRFYVIDNWYSCNSYQCLLLLIAILACCQSTRSGNHGQGGITQAVCTMYIVFAVFRIFNL